MPVFHRQLLTGEIPVFLCLLVTKIIVSMGFSSQGILTEDYAGGFDDPRVQGAGEEERGGGGL
jgi:hypothetical protein